MRVYGRGLKKAPRPTGALASCATAAEDVRPNYGIDTTLGILYAVSCGAKKAVITTITATEARKLLEMLLDEVADSREPIRMTVTRGRAVLVSEDHWRAAEKRVCLDSIPETHGSIVVGIATPVDACLKRVGGVVTESVSESVHRKPAGEWGQLRTSCTALSRRTR